MATVRSTVYAGKVVAVPVPNTFGATSKQVRFNDEGTAVVDAAQAEALVSFFPRSIELVKEEKPKAKKTEKKDD